MWVKIDDGFATHPKIIKAGPLALALQIRALCYCSQQRTDGFISEVMLPYLLLSLPTETYWPDIMVNAGLWDRQDKGYQIHDYLEWNCSKKDYERWKKKLSSGGKKGMKSRWDKDNLDITRVITQDISRDVTVSSTATATLIEGKECEKGEPNWFTALRRNPIYAHVDFTVELGKIDEWRSRPKNKHRHITQRFVSGWLNRIEPPLTNGKGLSHPLHCDKCNKDYPDLAAKKTHDFCFHPQYVG